MRPFSDQDIKDQGLIILDDVAKFCDEHNLKYVLFYGTLLGAVRHKGYIPWDDDVDIAMPRKDYEYFIHHYDNENFGVKDCFTDKLHYLAWAKAYNKKTIKKEPSCPNKKYEIGFNIDVFPVDEFSSPDNYWNVKEKEYKLIDKFMLTQTILLHDGSFKDFLRRIVKATYGKKANKISKKLQMFFIDNDSSKIKTCLVSNPIFMGVKTRKHAFPKDMFENRVLATFEDRKYFIPKCYDEVLTNCYGDYMKFPPKEQQVAHHDFEAYFK